jgi:hypothetical protein
LDDERLDAFVDHLARLADHQPHGALVGNVLTGRSLLELMTSPPIDLSQKLAIARLRGVLIGPDGQQTCAIITIRVLGLLSLGYSDLSPIRLFGVFSAVGVAIGATAQFLLLPAGWLLWMPRDIARPRNAISAVEPTSHLGVWPTLGRSVVEHWRGVLAGCLAIVVLGAIGLPKIQTSIQLMRLFSRSTSVIPMTRWLEDHLGATVPLEVIVRIRPESQTAPVDRMKLVAAIQARLREVQGASGCLSAATFAPPVRSRPGYHFNHFPSPTHPSPFRSRPGYHFLRLPSVKERHQAVAFFRHVVDAQCRLQCREISAVLLANRQCTQEFPVGLETLNGPLECAAGLGEHQ